MGLSCATLKLALCFLSGGACGAAILSAARGLRRRPLSLPVPERRIAGGHRRLAVENPVARCRPVHRRDQCRVGHDKDRRCHLAAMRRPSPDRANCRGRLDHRRAGRRRDRIHRLRRLSHWHRLVANRLPAGQFHRQYCCRLAAGQRNSHRRPIRRRHLVRRRRCRLHRCHRRRHLRTKSRRQPPILPVGRRSRPHQNRLHPNPANPHSRACRIGPDPATTSPIPTPPASAARQGADRRGQNPRGP